MRCEPSNPLPHAPQKICGDTPPPPAISPVMDDDAGDLIAAQSGDRQAFARLYDRHAGVVLCLCRRHFPAGAEDALQETFIRAYRMLDQLDSPVGLRPWLYAIARRVCAESRRAAQRRATHEERSAMNRATQIHVATLEDESLDNAERLERLGTALDALPDDERLAIHLFYLEADPVAAASSALKLSRSAFYKLLSRARERLACLMREVPT